MDRTISASEANQRFSEMLRDVADGASFTVISRGRPVARVLPFDRDAERQSFADLIGFVDKLPRRRSGDWSRDDLYE